MVTVLESKPKILKKRRLGTIMMERRLITNSQLEHALRIQDGKKGYLGKILVELGYISERDIVIAIVIQCHIPYIAINDYELDHDVVNLVPAELAHKYHVMPLDRVNHILSIVMADPFDTEARIELQSITNCRLMLFISTQSEIEKAIFRWYDN